MSHIMRDTGFVDSVLSSWFAGRVSAGHGLRYPSLGGSDQMSSLSVVQPGSFTVGLSDLPQDRDTIELVLPPALGTPLQLLIDDFERCVLRVISHQAR